MTIVSKKEAHVSHNMTEWRNTIVTICETPRFGSIRKCTNCDAEHATTAAGEGIDDELLFPCAYAEQV